MTIDELAAELPNGFHDCLLRTFTSEPAERRAEFIVDIWLGDLRNALTSDRECRRRARLDLSGLAYLMVDNPDPRYPVTNGLPLQIDTCAADDNPALAGQVPQGGFAGRFFVNEWNGFIHFAALEACLTWLDTN